MLPLHQHIETLNQQYSLGSIAGMHSQPCSDSNTIVCFPAYDKEKEQQLAKTSFVVTENENVVSGGEHDEESIISSTLATSKSRRSWTLSLRRSTSAVLALLARTIVLATIPALFGILYGSNRMPIEK